MVKNLKCSTIFKNIELSIKEYNNLKKLMVEMKSTLHKHNGITNSIIFQKSHSANIERLNALERFFIELGIATYLPDKNLAFFPIEGLELSGEIKYINRYEEEICQEENLL